MSILYHSNSTSAIELLSCIQHLFTWISLDDLVSEQFLINLLELGKWNQVCIKTIDDS